MSKTPWTKSSSSSSFPSDRLRPKNSNKTNYATQQQRSSGSNTPSAAGAPQSKQVRKLQKLLHSLQRTNDGTRDPLGGCFCLAREHALSPYTPICQGCGLILCTLNLPHYTCPFCSARLLTSASKATLISKIENAIMVTIKKEEEDRERIMEAARRAQGEFPTLSAAAAAAAASQSAGGASNVVPPPPAQNKILSIDSKTHKVTTMVTKKKKNPNSHRSTPASSTPASRPDTDDDEDDFALPSGTVRVPHPPLEPDYVPTRHPNETLRPWENLRRNIVYVPPKPEPKAQGDTNTASGSSKRSGKTKKDKAKENSG